jgi:hypothetical protein
MVLGEAVGKLNASYRMAFVMSLDDAHDFAQDVLAAVRRRRQRDGIRAPKNGEPPENEP